MTSDPGAAAPINPLGLDFQSVGSVPDVVSHAAPVPRLGVWVPWADTDSIGWVRYSLDQRHIPYIYVRDEDIRAGKLRDKYDVLLYGHVDLELGQPAAVENDGELVAAEEVIGEDVVMKVAI